MTLSVLAWVRGMMDRARGRLTVAALLGALAALGQAPLGWWGVTLVALALAMRLSPIRATTRGAALWWYLVGAGHFTACLFWIVSPFLVDADYYAWMAPFALVLFCGGMALFWGLAGGLGGWLRQRLGMHEAWTVALCLSVVELARGYVLTGFPWGTPGHVWIDSPLSQLAALVGPNGLTLITFALAAALAGLGRLQVLGAVAVLAGGYGWGSWTLSLPMPPDRPQILRLVQPNAEQGLKWDEDQAQVFFDRLTAMSAASPAVDMVIWPETALPYTMDSTDPLAKLVATSGNGAIMAIGRQRLEAVRGWNTLSFLEPGGRVIADYDKAHLVPFGEYLPLGDLAYRWLGIAVFAAEAGTAYSAGAGPDVIDLGPDLGRVMPLICYEAIFPQELRRAEMRAGHRADWLLQVTNDAWFGTITGPWQHAAQTRLRAIEQGLPMVRVANTGITAIYDARGREVASLPFGIASYLDHALPAALPAPPYSRFGESFTVLLLAGLGFILLLRRGLAVT